MKAIQNKIILKRPEGEKMTAGGIALPDTASRYAGQFTGVVVAVGPGKPVGVDREGMIVYHPPEVAVGDTVHFHDYHGAEVEIEGEKYLAIDEDDVLAID